VTVTLRWYHLK